MGRKTKKGNGEKYVLMGEHLQLLAIHRSLFPKANADEVIAFIQQYSSYAHRPYSRDDIYTRDKMLGLTRKKGSTTAMQALTDKNILRRQLFWSRQYPVGIHGTPRGSLIDIDESGWCLKATNRSHGKSLRGTRVREPGAYGHGDKWTLIMAIDPTGVLHYTFRKIAGTSLETYNQFLVGLIQIHLPSTQPPVNGPQRTILHDNLNSHLHALCWNTINDGGHRVVARTPYSPMDGPVEYAFNTIGNELQKSMHLVKDDNDFIAQMRSIINNLGSLDNYFLHCGYL